MKGSLEVVWFNRWWEKMPSVASGSFPSSHCPSFIFSTTFKELSVYVRFSVFSPPTPFWRLLPSLLSSDCPEITAIFKSPVPCHLCTHHLYLTLGNADHFALETTLLQFACCSTFLFPHTPLVATSQSFFLLLFLN